MKHMRKVFALALTLIMALALTVPAFAAEITITNAQKDETYTAYKIFNYTSSGTNFAYTMPSSSEWRTVVDSYKNAADQDVFTLTPSASDPATLIVTINDDVEFKTDAQAAHFANYLSSNIPSFAAGSAVAPISGTADATGKVDFTGLDAGYYFVDTSLGSLCSLFNQGTQQSLQEKNSEPTLEKKIIVGKDDEGNDILADATTVSIGDTVNYKITVTDGIGTDSTITVHDMMETGLTLDKGSIKVNGVTYQYSVPSDNCVFEVVLDGSDYVDGQKIVITYSATLNENAEIAGATNDNTAWLTYSEQESTKDIVTVSTYEFDLVKTTSDDNGMTVLNGAQFKLYDANTEGEVIDVVKVSDGVYRVAMEGETGVAIEAGNVTIKGLKGNTDYYLEETVAPDGYNKLTERVKVEIKEANLKATVTSQTITVGEDEVIIDTYVEGGVRVINLTGIELPSTGGIGTTIFYVVGGLLMAGAIILLITKKKLSNEQ